jgi:alkanesulfonate monooxygenase SsuD/methylene tetrahydromethanopterin reductase-like flavin-dependent oxidoreductase (luciferase family)
VASQTVTLDQLSNGRAILAVGLGATTTGLDRMGEITDRRARAEMLDEGIDLSDWCLAEQGGGSNVCRAADCAVRSSARADERAERVRLYATFGAQTQ